MRALALLALLASPAAAQVVTDCDRHEANARNLARPYSDATREFANGAITFMDLQQDEPACCGAHLLVLLPDPEIGDHRICAFVTTSDGRGWSDLDLTEAVARYDASTGLAVRVPATDLTRSTPLWLRVTVDQQSGVVAARGENR